MRSRFIERALRRRDRESGQAITEFAIILFPLLLLVAGIIQFGIGLNFWLDMQRIANQGARWAVVNCGAPATAAEVCNPTLEAYLESQPLSQGNTPDVTICFEAKTGGDPGNPTPTVGDPITVKLTEPFTFVPVVGLGTINLHASATMRLEQRPTLGGLGSAPDC
ncbi:MAG TPA: TadE/TadG family type IV pilus assembly protein [Gaiellaceae bacterium]|nr:TadE/TadG family type IV pilus assembly protein [Gaiellaceae bacterium]